MTLHQGDPLTLEITDLSREGDGLAAHEGLEIVAPGLYPGELAQLTILHRERHRPRAHAALAQLLRAHPARRPPPCPAHSDAAGRCTGCAWSTLSEPAQRSLKRDSLSRLFGHELEDLVYEPGGEFGYRRSSKRVVGGATGALRLGSYVRGGHEVAAMSGCLIEDPAITAAADELERAANDLFIQPYDEARRRGDLRYVWFKSDGQRVLLTLITAAAPSRAADLLPAALSLPAGIAWSVQSSASNAIRSAAPVTILRGAATLTAQLAGGDYSREIGPLGFLQPNPRVIERAYQDLIADPTGAPLHGQLALDLYAGDGVTTALLRRGHRFQAVIPCESFAESAERLGVAPRPVADFLKEQLEGAPRGRPELVIANPPRAGLGHEVCELLGALAPARLHIMSCGPAALARDLSELCARGYHLQRVRAYDTLPQTPHVELVAWLRR
jgi:23S rRNA (uracil1939-C5)-methyltransferase